MILRRAPTRVGASAPSYAPRAIPNRRNIALGFDHFLLLRALRVLPGWAWVDMIDRDVGRAGDTVIVLGYRAESSRNGAEPYRCFCTSTYRADGGRWKLVQHQQTLAG
jgi:hypothetical protein